jgi:hypothetical protein
LAEPTQTALPRGVPKPGFEAGRDSRGVERRGSSQEEAASASSNRIDDGVRNQLTVEDAQLFSEQKAGAGVDDSVKVTAAI